MPIVVNELVFKGVIKELPDNDQGRGLSSQAKALNKLEKKALVEACVEEVLKILAREQER